MADLSEIPIVRDSDSVDVVAPDVQRVDASFEEEEYGGGDGIGEEEVVNYEDDMFEIDEDGGEEEYEDDYEAQFLALQVCSLHTNQIRQSGGCKAPPPLNFWNNAKKCIFHNRAESRFMSLILDAILGPPRLARRTLRCPCFFGVLEATHEASSAVV